MVILDIKFNLISNRSINLKKPEYVRDFFNMKLKVQRHSRHFKIHRPIGHKIERSKTY